MEITVYSGWKFYSQIDTPVGNIQQEHYTFILNFNQPVSNIVQVRNNITIIIKIGIPI